ncbi:centromere protein X isoform X2 [Saccopteryx bilineata]|uniref:centromere protein X isoform X2 n=1 Tax=Saccopteryx bilineata TaxID=59482 RepID=UPI00338F78F1
MRAKGRARAAAGCQPEEPRQRAPDSLGGAEAGLWGGCGWRWGTPKSARHGGGHGGSRCLLPQVSGDALLLMAELLKIFVLEAAIRSVQQSQAEDLACVDVNQLEKVLPQLLLDF